MISFRQTTGLLAISAAAICLAQTANAKVRAGFLKGQYATEENCKKLRKIEAGTPKTIANAPELLDADGFKGWEGGCNFTQVFTHEPGSAWLGLMVCGEGATITPAMYLFMKSDTDDSFEVAGQNQEMPELYIRCDSRKDK